MYCAKCGTKAEEGDTFCRKCGAKLGDASEAAEQTSAGVGEAQKGDAPAPQQFRYGNDSGFSESGRYPSSDNPEYKASGGWALLGFLIPLVGLILYLVWRDKNRADAAKGRKAGKGALAGVIVWVVISILSFVIGLL